MSVPEAQCDIVMKGGITSGVVYPGVLFELASKYRFRSIGGASAGAIAAGMAAAAEYGRQHGNVDAFDQLNALSEELSTDLLGLFQPQPQAAPLYAALLAAIGKHEDKTARTMAVLGSIARNYRSAALIGMLPAAVLLAAGIAAHATMWTLALATLLLGLLGVAISLGWRAYVAVNVELPRLGYGMCSGASTGEQPALTEWLHARIQALAGRGNSDAPLTFGDLFGEGGRAKPNIELLVMTTSLTHQRPFQVPFQSREFAYAPDEFRALFPEDVVAHMDAHSTSVDGHRWLPVCEHFPIIVAIRMSLSFPGLLAAVPLHARDFAHNAEAERQKLRPVWMSDGGICSNFPIHFFDSVWPSRPTFGINLTSFDPDVHRDSRIYLPTDANQGMKRPFHEVGDTMGFARSIISTMQDWRDVTQTALPGYRERIVQIALSEEEGGLNLTMPPKRIATLAGYGTLAGEALTDDFDFAAHRWRRHLVWMACLERLLEQGKERYAARPAVERAKAIDPTLTWHERALSMGLAEFLDDYGPAPGSYNQDVAIHNDALENLERLMNVADQWKPVVKYNEEGRMTNIPRPPVEFRLTPTDRLPFTPESTNTA